jgi:CubicO group peptidase (beta-lactamase class C family)
MKEIRSPFFRLGFFGRIPWLAGFFVFSGSASFSGTNTTNGPSFEELGQMYFYGKGVPRDFKKSFDYFRQAAEMGSGSGQSWVGYLYQNGQGVSADYGEALRWTKMAAEQGRAFDANRLAGYYWEGLGTPIDREEALRWLKIAADKGDANSQKQVPVWRASWENEKKERLEKSGRSKADAETKLQPALWRVAGPWKLPSGDAREWFAKVDFVEVSKGMASGAKSIFLGEERQVLEVDAQEAGNFAKSLGTHADRIALVQGRWTAEKAGKALLAVGSDDAIKVWVNGKLVVSDWVGRKLTPYEDLFAIEVQKGENQIHAVVVNFYGHWGFFLSLPEEKTKAELLAQAIGKGDYEKTQTLLETGADPRKRVVHGLPSLELAQTMKRTHVEELLRSFGARESLLAWSHYPNLVRWLGPWFLPKNKKHPGYGFLIARGGQVVFEHYSGLANVENKVGVGPHTKFAIGSVSKQFVAAAMARMQEEGKLKLSDPLSKYLPDFPRGYQITLRQLLAHTSGIREYTKGKEFHSRGGNAPGPGEVYQSILVAPYGDRPGRRFSYSNSNYYLAGMILEKVTGENLRDLLNRLFFEPLGMKDTELAQGGATIENYATAYFMRNGQPERANTWNMDWAAGAGGMVSTPRDLFLWNEGLWGGKVLRPETLKEILRPEASEFSQGKDSGEGYACGWGVVKRFGQTWIGHGGSLPPYQASLFRIPDLQITVVALTNAGEGYGMGPDDMTSGGTCIFFGDELAGTVRDIPSAKLSKEQAERRAGLYDDGVGVYEIFQTDGRWYWRGAGFKDKLRVAGEQHLIGQESAKILELDLQDGGEISGAKIMEPYFPIFLEKLPPQKDSEEFVRARMGEYTGRYSFGPHGDYEVTQEEGRLYGKLGQQQKIPFRVLDRDDFEVEGVGARFSVVRDASGKITGADFRQHGVLIEAFKTK